jgi:hypothetical protein
MDNFLPVSRDLFRTLTHRRNGCRYLLNIPGRPPPILAIIRLNLPIFFIIACIWPNLLRNGKRVSPEWPLDKA